ncbi:MAG: hypothetical protein JWM87_3724 [Candidatus Eremiobacteraeota bacterium]|nr:hypothetical protein [Candidatus Eremiobacteraeota bacterium]
MNSTWNKILVPDNEFAPSAELFHENSKLSPNDAPAREDVVRARMARMGETLSYRGYPAIALPAPEEPRMPLAKAVEARATSRKLESTRLPFERLAALLACSYGQTRDLRERGYQRRFRTVPSAGALYPLEIYCHTTHVGELAAGVYHYHPIDGVLRLTRKGDETRRLSEAFVQPELPLEASAIFFITALFERSTFKYGERGYRFLLLEAGHVAQNLNLVATAFGMGVVNVGGFFDDALNEVLGLDGVTHAVLYAVVVGGAGDERDPA